MRSLLSRLTGGWIPAPITGRHDQCPFSAEYDDFLCAAMDAGDVRVSDKYVAVVGGAQVWIANYPYAFGRPCCGIEVLPSLATRKRLHSVCASATIPAPREKRRAS